MPAGDAEVVSEAPLRPGMQCLLEVLRGKVGFRAVAEVEWQAALEFAELERVLPWFAHVLKEQHEALPQTIQEQLLQAEREAMLYAFLQGSELKELLRGFATAKIDVLPLKGPYLAERVYGDTGLRISRDLDLLVRKPDFAAGVMLLQESGFVAVSRADDYHQSFRWGDTVVELHFDVENRLAIDFDVASAWTNASLGDFDGQPAWLLAPEDEVLYLCLHGVRHRFERLSLLVDVELAMKRFGLRSASEVCLRREVEGARRLLMLGCALVKRLEGREHSSEADDSAARRMDALAERLWRSFLTESAEQMDWRSIHAFYLETELTTLRKVYRRVLHWRILATRLIDADFAFAAGVGLQRSWQVWFLRPVRLLLRQAERKRRTSRSKT